jgi:uncharacterized protein with PIN domain
MMGHNVEYSNSMDDAGLLAAATNDRRILLTRDFELCQHAISRQVDAFYVEGKTEEERLAEVAKRFGINLEINMATSRCPKCNTPIKAVSKEKVLDKIEKDTIEHYDEFWVCRRCGQVYWQGSHWTNIRVTLGKAEKNLQVLKKGSA